MTSDVDIELLERAVNQLRHGRSVEDIVAEHPKQAEDLRGYLWTIVSLRMAQYVDNPDAAALVADKNSFLTKLNDLQQAAVSPSPFVRLRGWILQKTALSSLPLTIQNLEVRKMSVIAVKIALILLVVFGSLGGTLSAAADSLPGSAIYPIKLSIEKARLALNRDLNEQTVLHLEFAQERIEEMLRLASSGQLPREDLSANAHSHMRDAYQLIAQADDEEVQELLAAALVAAQTSQSDLETGQEIALYRIRERLREASGMMAQWQQAAENGLQDPAYFRCRYGPGAPHCEGDECYQACGDGDQEQHQHQYGPGDPPCEGDECLPPYGDSDQEQHQHQYGPGEPPCEGDECQPPYGDGSQNQNGPGDPPCEGNNCQPPNEGGSQNQNNEQNQEQGETQNQNQEQNNPGESDPGPNSPGTPGGSDNSSGSAGSGGSGGGGM